MEEKALCDWLNSPTLSLGLTYIWAICYDGVRQHFVSLVAHLLVFYVLFYCLEILSYLPSTSSGLEVGRPGVLSRLRAFKFSFSSSARCMYSTTWNVGKRRASMIQLQGKQRRADTTSASTRNVQWFGPCNTQQKAWLCFLKTNLTLKLASPISWRHTWLQISRTVRTWKKKRKKYRRKSQNVLTL